MGLVQRVAVFAAMTAGALALVGYGSSAAGLSAGPTVARNLRVDALTATWRRNSEVGSTGTPQPQPTTRADCGAWSGGDGTQVVRLANGDDLWTFGDTFLGPAVARQDFFNNGFIRNSMVRQAGRTFTTITGGTSCPGSALGAVTPFSPAASADVDWPGSSLTYGSNLVKFYYSADAAALEPEEPQVASMPQADFESGDTITPTVTTQLNKCGYRNVMWGLATVAATTGRVRYTYIYGEGYNRSGRGSRLYLARTSGDPATQATWTYYTGGTRFSAPPAGDSCASLPLAALGSIEVATELSVTVLRGAFWLVQDDPADGTYRGWAVAHEALEPWSFTNAAKAAVPLFRPARTRFRGIDDSFPGAIGYGAKMLSPAAVTASVKGDVVVSYNVNSNAIDPGCISLVYYDANAYAPRFIDVPVADFVTRIRSARSAPASPPAASAQAASPLATPAQAVSTASQALAPRDSLFAPPLVKLGTAQLARARAEAARSGWTYNPETVPSQTTWTVPTSLLSRDCPPVRYKAVDPKVRLVADADGAVQLSWPSQGADVWYWVHWQDQTASRGKWTQEELWAEGPNADGWQPPVGRLPASTGKTIESHFVPSAGQNGDHYIFWMQAFAAGDGKVTGPGSAASPPAPTGTVIAGVATPQDLKAAAGTDGNVTLTWRGIAAEPGESISYEVQYKLGSATSWTAASQLYTTTTATISALETGQLYDFRVAAVNDVGPGSFSKAATATP